MALCVAVGLEPSVLPDVIRGEVPDMIRYLDRVQSLYLREKYRLCATLLSE